MNARVHEVSLNGVSVGLMAQAGDAARFRFDEDYWQRPGREVLGLWFENNPHTSPKAALRLPQWFSNLLPEGRLREWIALDRNVSVQREMELLLRVGTDLPGAIQVAEEGTEADGVDWEELGQLPSLASREQLWKFSLAGVGLKFSMLAAGDKLTLPARHELGDWIVKMPEPGHPLVPLNEYAMMRYAGLVGIDVPETRLVHRDQLSDLPSSAWPNSEVWAYAVARFDRAPSRRVHIEDMAQVRGFYPEQKYDGAFETVGALYYREIDDVSLFEFVRRLTFNLLIGNGDAHLKNWSLIYDRGNSPRISPAYDIVSTVPYFDDGEENTGLTFGGTRRFAAIRRYDFQRMAQKLRVNASDILRVVDDTVELFFEERGALALLEELPGFEDRIVKHASALRTQLSQRQL